MNIGGNFLLSVAAQRSITAEDVLTFPVVLMGMLFVPYISTVQERGGGLNANGTSTIFKTKLVEKLFS